MVAEVKHQLILIDRYHLSITGVSHVAHFDAAQIILETVMGVLLLQGEELNINHLNLEQGDLVVVGQLKTISYLDEQGMKYIGSKSRGVWRRLLK